MSTVDIGFTINGTPYSNYVFEADIWRETQTGIGRWEVLTDPIANYWPGAFAVDDDVTITLTVDGVGPTTMMMGYLDDIEPYLGKRGVRTDLWKFSGRDYGMDLAQFYFTATRPDYRYVRSGNIIRDVITTLNNNFGVVPPPYQFPEITPPAAGIGNHLYYEWADRTYLADGFREIAELDDHDFYIQDNAARQMRYFPIGTVASGVTLINQLNNLNSNILELSVGEALGFKMKNYIEVSAGFLDDHYTEPTGNPAAPPAPDWLAGPSSTRRYEYTIYLNGKGSLYCEQVNNLNWMYIYLQFPRYNHVSLDLRDESLHLESECLSDRELC